MPLKRSQSQYFAVVLRKYESMAHKGSRVLTVHDRRNRWIRHRNSRKYNHSRSGIRTQTTTASWAILVRWTEVGGSCLLSVDRFSGPAFAEAPKVWQMPPAHLVGRVDHQATWPVKIGGFKVGTSKETSNPGAGCGLTSVVFARCRCGLAFCERHMAAENHEYGSPKKDSCEMTRTQGIFQDQSIVSQSPNLAPRNVFFSYSYLAILGHFSFSEVNAVAPNRWHQKFAARCTFNWQQMQRDKIARENPKVGFLDW